MSIHGPQVKRRVLAPNLILPSDQATTKSEIPSDFDVASANSKQWEELRKKQSLRFSNDIKKAESTVLNKTKVDEKKLNKLSEDTEPLVKYNYNVKKIVSIFKTYNETLDKYKKALAQKDDAKYNKLQDLYRKAGQLQSELRITVSQIENYEKNYKIAQKQDLKTYVEATKQKLEDLPQKPKQPLTKTGPIPDDKKRIFVHKICREVFYSYLATKDKYIRRKIKKPNEWSFVARKDVPVEVLKSNGMKPTADKKKKWRDMLAKVRKVSNKTPDTNQKKWASMLATVSQAEAASAKKKKARTLAQLQKH